MNLKTYKFSLVRYIPNPDRGEGLNVGLIIRDDEKLLVEWDKDFRPTQDFAPEWSKDEMIEWQKYYEKEFDIKDKMTKYSINNLKESFWELVRNKVKGPYVLCDTRLNFSREVNIEIVAKSLLKELVLRS